MLYKLSFALLFAVLTCAQIAFAQIKQSGKCPEVKLMDAFSWSDFKGIWFEYARYPTDTEGDEECVYGDYKGENDGTIGVTVAGVNASDQPISYDVTAKILGPGVFFVTYNENDSKRSNKVLGTDYKSWSVIYSCVDAGDDHSEKTWIFTRERNPKEETVTKAKEVLVQNGVSTGFLRYTRQHDCPDIKV